VIEGPAGVGKTRLVELVADGLGDSCSVVWARADALDQDQPFSAVHELVRFVGDPSLRDALLTGAPGFVARLAEEVERVARDRPLVVVAEDFQWADPASWRVVRSLASMVGNVPLSLAVIIRTPIDGDGLTVVNRLRAYGAVQCVLDDLTVDEVRELTQLELGRRTTIDEAFLFKRSGGNALFVTELLRYVRDEARREATATTGTTDTGTTNTAGHGAAASADSVSPIPGSLRVAVMSRLAALGTTERQLLGLASLLGSRFSVDELAEIADRPVLDVVAELRNTLQAGILAAERHELRFSHALVGDCIRDDQPAALRQPMHRHIASVLAGRGAPLQRVAEHYVLAAVGDDGTVALDENAATWLTRAATDAQATSLPTAMSLLERAVRISPPGEGATARRIALATLYLLGGRHSEAEVLCRALLDDRTTPIEPHAETSSRGVLAAVLALRGPVHAPAAVEQFDAVQALVGPGGSGHRDASLAADTLAGKALVVLYTGEIAAAKMLAEQAITEAIASSNRSARSRAHEVLALAALVDLDAVEARAQVMESLAWFSPSNGPWAMLITPHLTASLVLVSLGELDEAIRVCTDGIGICTASGHLMPRLYLLPCLAVFHLIGGNLDEAHRLAALTNELVDDWCPNHPSPATRAIVGYVLWLRGDPTAAVKLADRAAQEMWDSGTQVAIADLIAWLIASVYEGVGRVDDAFGVMHLVWSLIGGATGAVVMAADLVRLALDRSPDVAAVVVSMLESRFAASPTIRNGIVFRRSAALVARDPDALRSVATELDGTGNVLSAMWSRRDAAVLDTQLASTQVAEQSIRDVIKGFDALNAPVASNELRALARTIGVNLRPTKQRSRSELSETETLVARLAADGLTNREIGERLFISARTAEAHLTHVFTKLGVKNRVQLTAALSAG
jgi:DNA-binding NarL/FixJ family response regulator